MDKVLDEQAKVQDKIEAANAWDLDSRLELAMDALRLPPGDADVTKLSGGERRRVALCRLLLKSPDLLLLDEPTNHLDAESVAWLERFLKDYPGHRRRASRTIATSSTTSPAGSSSSIAARAFRGKGTTRPGSSRSRTASRWKRRAESRRQRTLERELEWIRMSPRARQAKGKARLNALRGPAQGRKREEDRVDRDLHSARSAARRHRRRSAQPEEGLRRHAADGRRELHAAARRHRRRDRPQRRRQDDAVPDDHRRRSSPTAARCGSATPCRSATSTRRASSIRRSRCSRRSPAAATSWSSASARWRRAPTCRGSTSRGPASRARSGSSPAASATASTSRSCSRVARTCCCSTSRPTISTSNTLRALEEALLNFGGCAVVISHDRWFLDRIATHILAFEGDSKVVWFEGNYQDYEADRHRRLGAEADQPHRIKYRKLTR